MRWSSGIYNSEYLKKPDTKLFCYDLLGIEKRNLMTFWRSISILVSKKVKVPVFCPVVFVDKDDPESKEVFTLLKKLGQIPPSTFLFLVSSGKSKPNEQLLSFLYAFRNNKLAGVISPVVNYLIEEDKAIQITSRDDIDSIMITMYNSAEKYVEVLSGVAKNKHLVWLSGEYGLRTVEDNFQKKLLIELEMEVAKKMLL